ncbi:MAG: SGNH/GDSL hydrolase family protein [Candidatus Marinimicrobia bacterium]|nr:SGNH/GDSL hydrolase family protein [Candidatus Neomarinimicrobiota bacterium]
MKRSLLFPLFCMFALSAFSDPVFHDALPYLEGCAFEGCPPFGRLPRELEDRVRPPVWRLGRNSAGLAAHFFTDSREIRVYWEVLNDFHMVHMAGTGIRGVDLYVKEDTRWRHIATGKPFAKQNTAELIGNLSGEMREYLLYCPLYDGLAGLELGIGPEAEIRGAVRPQKPVVFYGTSITQGGCASRPGMAYPAIAGRMLERETINLGFSGNGRMDPEIMEAVAEIDAAFYVIDCLPNMNLEMIRERAEGEIRRILDRRPEVPVLLVPNFMPESGRYDPEVRNEITEENTAFRTLYSRLKKDYKHLYYLPSRKLRGVPEEGTVDGIHLSDLGQQRMAEVLVKSIRRHLRP